MGGADPSSGTASFVETIRGLGVLMSKGWRPLRTVVLASWDAEEVCSTQLLMTRLLRYPFSMA